jgi:hypothetical protein
MRKNLFELVTMLREDRAREVLAQLAPEYSGPFDPLSVARRLDEQRKTPIEAFDHLTISELRSVALAWCRESQVGHFLSERVDLVKLLKGVVVDPVHGCP